MEWTQLQQEAKDKGYLVFAMNQAETVQSTEPGPWGAISGGYCLGLSATWAAFAYKGMKFPVEGDICVNPPWQATAIQNLVSDSNGITHWTQYWQLGATYWQCGLSKGLRAERHHKPTASFLWSIMSKAYGCYAVTLTRAKQGGVKGGAHAICLRHAPDDRYHLFDPNRFHIVVDDAAAFRAFVSRYIYLMGYEKDYPSLTGIVGIAPHVNGGP